MFPPLVLIMGWAFFLFSHSCNGNLLQNCNFNQIYQLGDSLSDTGNYIRESSLGAATLCGSFPYGETFFKNATGRCCDGRLMIDYIATAAKLPFLNPYDNMDANFSYGVNFAVVGATALSAKTLASKNISSSITNSSLSVQLDRMSKYFNSTCYTRRDCAYKHQKSLFLVGEIGGNDYNYAFFQGKSIEEVKNLVPIVVQTIVDAIRKVISYGAIRILVPGNFPIGCLPIYLTGFQTNDFAAYDENNCLKIFNSFSMYHNYYLQHSIEELSTVFPNVVIVYSDYYNAFQWLLLNAPSLGFDTTSLLKACCGTGGDYNFSPTEFCEAPGVPVCSNPNQHISWDGIHLTQEAYMIIATWLVNDTSHHLQCSV